MSVGRKKMNGGGWGEEGHQCVDRRVAGLREALVLIAAHFLKLLDQLGRPGRRQCFIAPHLRSK